MKNSLFRIDKNSITAESGKTTGFVVLPCLEEMMLRTESEEAAPAKEDVDALVFEEEKKPEETREESMQRQLLELDEQIKEAKAQAEKTLLEAQENARKIYEKAEREGYAAGVEKAAMKVKEERAEEKESLAGALKAFSSAVDSLYAEMEKGVLDLSLYIAEHIVKTEINDNEDAYINMIKNMLLGIKNQSNIIIKVGKEEFERFFADQTNDLADIVKNAGMKVVQDISLQPGDCLVQTEFGYMDAGILTQLKRMEYSLKQFGAGG